MIARNQSSKKVQAAETKWRVPVMIAFGVSVAVAVLFGAYPALNACRINPSKLCVTSRRVATVIRWWYSRRITAAEAPLAGRVHRPSSEPGAGRTDSTGALTSIARTREIAGLGMDKTTLLFKRHRLGQNWLNALPLALRPFRDPVLVAVAYFIGAQAAFSVGTLSDRIFAPFWPPNIILFCTLVLASKSRWWLYIAATFPAHVIAETTVAMPAAQSMVAFATNCMVAILSAYSVRRFLKEPPWFGTLQNAAIYILITAAISPAIAGLGGAFVQILGGGPIANYWTYWGNWWISNALGSVTLGPVLLTLFSPRPEGTSRLISRRKTEALLLTVTLVATCAIVFRVGEGAINTGFLPALLYSPLPLLLWAAIRFGQTGASGAILIVTVDSIWENLRTATVFMGIDAGTSVLALQIFVLGIAVPIFLLGAAIDELRRSEEATRRLAGALLRAQDEERARIARELHDSTGQNLVMANLMATQVQSAAPASCGPAIRELKEILQVTISEVRTVSYLLHPPLLDAGGLSVALQSYLDGFSKRTAISIDLKLSANVGRMAADVELVLFRVIQEALTNIWRHSGSKTAWIQLARQTSDTVPRVTLCIEDAGKGIPNNIRRSALSLNRNGQQAPSGLGLIGMRERLRQIGGELEIESVAGKTIVRAIVTLKRDTDVSEAEPRLL
jgi:signal transduction histidine kinase